MTIKKGRVLAGRTLSHFIFFEPRLKDKLIGPLYLAELMAPAFWLKGVTVHQRSQGKERERFDPAPCSLFRRKAEGRGLGGPRALRPVTCPRSLSKRQNERLCPLSYSH